MVAWWECLVSGVLTTHPLCRSTDYIEPFVEELQNVGYNVQMHVLGHQTSDAWTCGYRCLHLLRLFVDGQLHLNNDAMLPVMPLDFPQDVQVFFNAYQQVCELASVGIHGTPL